MSTLVGFICGIFMIHCEVHTEAKFFLCFSHQQLKMAEGVSAGPFLLNNIFFTGISHRSG